MAGDSNDPVTLERRITLLGGVDLIVGSIIGSGVFLTPGGLMQKAGSAGMALVLWASCGILCIIGALCFSELGTMFPEAGGEYTYILIAFGDLPAFLTLWMNVIIIRPAVQAVVALAFAEYAVAGIYDGDCKAPRSVVILLATWGLCLLTAVNCLSVKWTMKIQSVFTKAKVFALIVIIVVGGWVLVTEGTSNFDNAFVGDYEAGGIASALAFGMFSFGGWNYLNFLTEELRDPYRNLPRAIWIALPLVAVIYVLTNIAYLTVLTPDEIIKSNTVAVLFGQRVLGPLQYGVSFFVSLSTFGSLNGILMTSGRLFLAGARYGHLPSVLSYIGVNTRTPVPSLIMTCVISLIMLCVGEINHLISYLSCVLWITFGLATAGLIYFRKTHPNKKRPIKVHIIFAAIFLACCIFIVLLPLTDENDRMNTVYGFLMTLSGIPVYLIGVKWKGKPLSWIKFTAKASILIQKTCNVVAPTLQEEPLLVNGIDD